MSTSTPSDSAPSGAGNGAAAPTISVDATATSARPRVFVSEPAVTATHDVESEYAAGDAPDDDDDSCSGSLSVPRGGLQGVLQGRRFSVSAEADMHDDDDEDGDDNDPMSAAKAHAMFGGGGAGSNNGGGSDGAQEPAAADAADAGEGVPSPMSDEDSRALRESVQRCFLFRHLQPQQVEHVVQRMRAREFPHGSIVVQQGDDGYECYLIQSGEFDVIKDGANVNHLGAGELFGELALLHNTPRAATVVAVGQRNRCWVLSRSAFNAVLRGMFRHQRDKYHGFLRSVKIFQSMDAYDVARLADAFEERTFPAGTDIVKQDESGGTFYVIEEGECDVYKHGALVNKLVSGDYFGELALLQERARRATVHARTDVRCVELDRDAFNRLIPQHVREHLLTLAADYLPGPQPAAEEHVARSAADQQQQHA